MEYYVGLDISLRSCALCIVDSKGEVYLERELPCEIEDIADCLEAFVKWSGKTGQRAKMYPTLKTGYTNDQETQFFGQV